MAKEDDETNLESFLKWAAELGISDSPGSDSYSLGHTLSIANFPEAGGRGLAVARFINRGELILTVPKGALMTTDSLICKDPNFSTSLGKYPFLSSTQILSVGLLNEVNKGRNSWWYPYLKQLPQSYDLLASFSRFEIEALQIDDAILTAENTVQKAKMEWKQVTPLMCELKLKPQLLTFKAWLWVSATISSRTMHVSWDSAGCLCPVGDFFNYAPPEERPYLENSETSSFERDKTTYSSEMLFNDNSNRLTDAGYDEAAAGYCFYAKRTYSRGDQVLLSYGTYTNFELLEHYGFVLQENPNDKVYISLEPEMYSLCSWSKDSLYISHDGKPSFALLSTVRLWAIPLIKRKAIGHIVYSGHQISLENEVAVMLWIVKKCQELLSSCSTSIEEDSSLLYIIDKIQDYNPLCMENGGWSAALNSEICAFIASSSVANGKVSAKLQSSAKIRKSIDRWKLAVQWRYGYKKILSDCILHCNVVLDNPL